MGTHDELVEKARRWLIGTERCAVVITEMDSGAGECPDAIGFHPSYSVSIECKSNRADFLRDKKKLHVRSDRGMGHKQYYLAPPGVIKRGDLPDFKYGILEPRGRGLRVVHSPSGFFTKPDLQKENTLLISAIRRLGGNVMSGVSVRAYQYDWNSKFRATLGILHIPSEDDPTCPNCRGRVLYYLSEKYLWCPWCRVPWGIEEIKLSQTGGDTE